MSKRPSITLSATTTNQEYHNFLLCATLIPEVHVCLLFLPSCKNLSRLPSGIFFAQTNLLDPCGKGPCVRQ
jgi:hypothetical protein